MTKTFNTAEEAKAIIYDVNDQLGRLPYNSDLRKFCNNICNMVEELSKLEVYARRTHPRSRYNIQRKQLRETISASITQLEYYMLMARLMA